MTCQKCGNQFEGNFCSKCGAAASTQQTPPPPNGPQYYNPNQPPYPNQPSPPYMDQTYAWNSGISDKDQIVALLLCIFVGTWGIHRFYVGKVGTGILYIFTFGLFGIGWLVDLIQIACGNFKDNMGRLVKRQNF
ncbi:MAG: TM2 domain-containing protein [Clostridiales bacterium]|jgi:restriction system protein|nr:TM2 domain-containing protein [Clostridiales bacterium]